MQKGRDTDTSFVVTTRPVADAMIENEGTRTESTRVVV